MYEVFQLFDFLPIDDPFFLSPLFFLRHTVWNLRIFLPVIFLCEIDFDTYKNNINWQKIRESNVFTKLLKSWFDEIFLERKKFSFFIISSHLTLFIDENFVKTSVLLKKVPKSWFHEFFSTPTWCTYICVCILLQQPGRYDEKLQWKPMVSGLFHILFVHQPLFSDEFNVGRSLRCLHEDWKGEIPKTFFAQKKGCTTCFQTTRDPGKAGTSQLPAFGGPFDRI